MNKTAKRQKKVSDCSWVRLLWVLAYDSVFVLKSGEPPVMKSKAIMLNKYGLNVGAAYVEQSTLLEPNNFIPSWEAGDEEKKEVSNALQKLRENYDQIHRLVKDKEHALE